MEYSYIYSLSNPVLFRDLSGNEGFPIDPIPPNPQPIPQLMSEYSKVTWNPPKIGGIDRFLFKISPQARFHICRAAHFACIEFCCDNYNLRGGDLYNTCIIACSALHSACLKGSYPKPVNPLTVDWGGILPYKKRLSKTCK